MDFFIGEVIKGDTGILQFTLPENLVLIWKEGKSPEAVLCAAASDIPRGWVEQNHTSLKIFGDFRLIKSFFPTFKLPVGSKVIGAKESLTIQMDPSKGVIRYMGKRAKRALIVDDSPTIRKLLRKIISTFEGWEVVDEVESGEKIPEALKAHFPDLVTLDLNLINMNGAEAMKKFLAPHRIPTLLITSQPKEDGSLVMDALEAGALDYLQKPESGKWELLQNELSLKMETALKAKWQNMSHASASPQMLSKKYHFNSDEFLVTIGSSTGGTQALQQIFTRLPANIPPILVAQHIPAGFSKALAERLNKLCPFEIKEAEDGDLVLPNRVLIAPGDHHMRLNKNGKSVEVFAGEPVNRFRPSVEVLFKSVTAHSKVNTVGIMLTGMGKDGAEAMVEMHNKGAFTIAQDEASSVVFGMPKEAIRLGAADSIKPLLEIPEFLMEYLANKAVRLKKES
jgi:two-component system chemotaxis response regulator CheB